MKIEPIETPRLILRGFTKEDALWAYSIWNDPEMGEYLPDEAKQEVAPCGGRIVAEKAYKKEERMLLWKNIYMRFYFRDYRIILQGE